MDDLRRRTWAVLLAVLGLQACGSGEGAAIESDDPLHEAGIGLPPAAAVWLPPQERGPREIKPLVAPPTFSPGMFPCSRCHDGGPSVVDDTPAMPHVAHLEQGLTCADCHDSDDDPRVPTVDLCLSCHDDPSGDLPSVAAYFTDIEDEHGGWRLPRRWMTRDVDANHEGHGFVGMECAYCHGEPSDGPFDKPRPAALKQLCFECHGGGEAQDCGICHAEEREPAHADIVLRHAEDQRGCLDCHSAEDRDVLRLADGSSLPFDESYRLCGQCHGTQARDWRDGLHGKRTGMWDGEATALLCVHCHRDPHDPSFPAMKPLPPPMRPEEIR